jgi:hypothetical protein
MFVYWGGESDGYVMSLGNGGKGVGRDTGGERRRDLRSPKTGNWGSPLMLMNWSSAYFSYWGRGVVKYFPLATRPAGRLIGSVVPR